MLVWGQALNQKLTGLYNVQFATINTQVPGLLNRNLGGAWKSRLLEDPLSVPSRPVPSRPGWDSRGCLSCYRRAVHLLLTRARRLATLTGRGARQPHAHPRIRELWSRPRSVPRPPLALLSLPHRPFLPVRSGSTRRAGLSCARTSPGFLRAWRPLFTCDAPPRARSFTCPAPPSSHFHSRSAGPRFVARSFACPTSSGRSRRGLWLMSSRTSGFESLSWPNRPAGLVIAAVCSFFQCLPCACAREIRKQNNSSIRSQCFSSSSGTPCRHYLTRESCATILFRWKSRGMDGAVKKLAQGPVR